MDGEPFLLHTSSQAFLDGDARGIEQRFQFRRDALDYLAMASIVVGALVLLVAVGQVAGWLATDDASNATVSAFVVAVGLITIGAYFVNSRHSVAAAQARMIHAGQVLPGTIVTCTGRDETTTEASLGEVTRSYLVAVEYRFSAPDGDEIIGHAEHNRPDLRRVELPPPDTAVRVLYLDDGMYVLL